jgi:hypothetical protein
MKGRTKKSEALAKAATPLEQKPRRRGQFARLTRSALLAMSLTAAQLDNEADFVGDEVFHRNLVDRLHVGSLTRFHD